VTRGEVLSFLSFDTPPWRHELEFGGHVIIWLDSHGSRAEWEPLVQSAKDRVSGDRVRRERLKPS
jgi:hypothetical protein